MAIQGGQDGKVFEILGLSNTMTVAFRGWVLGSLGHDHRHDEWADPAVRLLAEAEPALVVGLGLALRRPDTRRRLSATQRGIGVKTQPGERIYLQRLGYFKTHDIISFMCHLIRYRGTEV